WTGWRWTLMFFWMEGCAWSGPASKSWGITGRACIRRIAGAGTGITMSCGMGLLIVRILRWLNSVTAGRDSQYEETPLISSDNQSWPRSSDLGLSGADLQIGIRDTGI